MQYSTGMKCTGSVCKELFCEFSGGTFELVIVSLFCIEWLSK